MGPCSRGSEALLSVRFELHAFRDDGATQHCFFWKYCIVESFREYTFCCAALTITVGSAVPARKCGEQGRHQTFPGALACLEEAADPGSALVEEKPSPGQQCVLAREHHFMLYFNWCLLLWQAGSWGERDAQPYTLATAGW